VEEHLRIGRKCAVNAHLNVPCLVAAMIGGADSIDDKDVLRHGAMPALFGGVRAPSTLGSFLRSFTWGNVWLAEEMTGHLGYQKHDPAGRGRAAAGAAEDMTGGRVRLRSQDR
jgi:hypothetical protein